MLCFIERVLYRAKTFIPIAFGGKDAKEGARLRLIAKRSALRCAYHKNYSFPFNYYNFNYYNSSLFNRNHERLKFKQKIAGASVSSSIMSNYTYTCCYYLAYT